MKKALWLILMLATGALYAGDGAEPKRTDVWAEFTWCGTESTPTETIHKYKLKLSPNFPRDRVSLVLAVDVFGGGNCTPLRELGNDFHLKYSVSPAKPNPKPDPKRGLLGVVAALHPSLSFLRALIIMEAVVRGHMGADIVANAALTFGGAPGHDQEIRFGCRKSPKLEPVIRVVLYPGDVTPLCALTTRTSKNSPTTEFRFSPWEKPTRAGLFLRLVPYEVLTKAEKGTPYHEALRREVLERLGISPDTAGGCDLDELDRCIAEYEECRLRFETGTATLAELLKSEIAVIGMLLDRSKSESDENELRHKYLTRQKRLLDLMKADFQAGLIGLGAVRKKEHEIVECRRKWGLPPANVFDPAFIGKVKQILVKHLGAPQLTFTCGGRTYCAWKIESKPNGFFLIFGNRGTAVLGQHELLAALKKAGVPPPELSSLKPVDDPTYKAFREIYETIEAMFGKHHFGIGSGIGHDYWVFDDGTVLHLCDSFSEIEIRKLPPQYHTATDDDERWKIFNETFKGPLYEF